MESSLHPTKVPHTTVRINVGGMAFKCHAATLETFEDSLLAKMDTTSTYYDDREKEYFFDRNPMIFQYILDGYRTGSLHIPGDMCGSKFREELQFWGLTESLVSKCCWEALYNSDDKVQTIETLEKLYEDASSGKDDLEAQNTMRHSIWQFLHEPNSSRHAKLWCVFISFIIVMSVLVTALESIPFTRTGTYSPAENASFFRALALLVGEDNRSPDTTCLKLLAKKQHIGIPVLEGFCFAVLTVELLVVFACSPNRRDMLKSWIHMSEVVCSIAFWIYFIIERNLGNIKSAHMIRAMILFKYITVLRLVRLFRIARHITALKIMGLTMWVSKYELAVLGLMLFMLTSLFGLLMYVAECTNNDTFDNVFTAMYWALITITTVGYGHYIPGTALGHVITSACAICGMIMLALPVGIFASNFNKLYHHHQYVSKHVDTMETKEQPMSRASRLILPKAVRGTGGIGKEL